MATTTLRQPILYLAIELSNSAAAGRERPVAIMVGAAHPTFLQDVLRAP